MCIQILGNEDPMGVKILEDKDHLKNKLCKCSQLVSTALENLQQSRKMIEQYTADLLTSFQN